jgi:hypothetical protein
VKHVPNHLSYGTAKGHGAKFEKYHKEGKRSLKKRSFMLSRENKIFIQVKQFC